MQVNHSREEWEKYSRSIAFHGRGGTDFTPVFRYVEELRRKKELSNLRTMIYFTDGDGIYPRIAPDYETAHRGDAPGAEVGAGVLYGGQLTRRL